MPMGVAQGDRVLIPQVSRLGLPRGVAGLDAHANTRLFQYGGSPVKVGEEEYHLFRDSE